MAVTAASTVEPTEAQMVRAILHAARILHWRVAHFRAARTAHGWRTAVQGDGAGFPDLVMVHPQVGVWWVELKTRYGHLDREQQAWGDALGAAGQRWIVCRGRAGLTRLLEEMVTP
jgi:VRR-NUC domain